MLYNKTMKSVFKKLPHSKIKGTKKSVCPEITHISSITLDIVDYEKDFLIRSVLKELKGGKNKKVGGLGETNSHEITTLSSH